MATEGPDLFWIRALAGLELIKSQRSGSLQHSTKDLLKLLSKLDPSTDKLFKDMTVPSTDMEVLWVRFLNHTKGNYSQNRLLDNPPF